MATATLMCHVNNSYNKSIQSNHRIRLVIRHVLILHHPHMHVNNFFFNEISKYLVTSTCVISMYLGFFFTLYFNDIYMFMNEKEKLEIKVLEFWGRDGYHWLIDSDVRSHFLSPAFLLASFFLVLGGGLQRTCAVRWRVLNVSDHHLNWLRSTLIHGWEIKNVLSELNRNIWLFIFITTIP